MKMENDRFAQLNYKLTKKTTKETNEKYT